MMDLVIKHLESELLVAKQRLFENDQKKSISQYSPHKVSGQYIKQLEQAILILKKGK